VSGVGLSIVTCRVRLGHHVCRSRLVSGITLWSRQLPGFDLARDGAVSSIMGEIMLIALPIDTGKTDPMKARSTLILCALACAGIDQAW
jgi:HME family heavy-metal exporter